MVAVPVNDYGMVVNCLEIDQILLQKKRRLMPQDGNRGLACVQCGAMGALRWHTPHLSLYCLACWSAYGPEAATVLRLLCDEPSLQRCHRARSTAFSAPPRSTNMRLWGAPQLEVTPEDSLVAALRLLRSGSGASKLPPIVLSMANGKSVGGGFLHDSIGQEEELCRRSDLFPQLVDAYWDGGFPLAELGAIVSPDVLVFRGLQQDGSPLLAEPYTVGVVTAAAPRAPDLSTRQARLAYRTRMRSKVDALLALISGLGYSDVVLSAWGCGAFRNPPSVVARVFRECLDGRFCGAFRRVVFAIQDRPYLDGERNYEVFRRELEQ